MSSRRSFNTALASLAAAGAIAAHAGAAPEDGEVAALRAEVAELRGVVAELRSAEGDDWLTERRAEEIRTLVNDVLADADTRASLLQSGMTAGWDQGFHLGSADGNFRLNISGMLQFRFVFNNQDNSPDDNTRWGFENSRTKLIFSGHVFDPNWVFRVEGDFNADRPPDDGQLTLEDAYIGKVFGDSGWTGLAGQFKVPMLRESLVYSGYQLAVDRSLVNQEFSAGRTQGIAADYRNDMFHVVGGITDGHPATGGQNRPALARDTEISLTARVEWLAMGGWSQFDQMTSWRGADQGLLVGGAIHWQKGSYGTAAPEPEVLQWTVDGSFHADGWNLFTYFVGRHIGNTGASSLTQYGFVFQGGYFFTEEWELFGRYEWGDSDVTGEDDLSVITFGVNRYFSQQQLKWTTDFGYGINSVGASWADGVLGIGGEKVGWRADAPDEDGQFVLRTQLQLLF